MGLDALGAPDIFISQVSLVIDSLNERQQGPATLVGRSPGQTNRWLSGWQRSTKPGSGGWLGEEDQ